MKASSRTGAIVMLFLACCLYPLAPGADTGKPVRLDLRVTPVKELVTLSTCLRQASASRPDTLLTPTQADWVIHITASHGGTNTNGVVSIMASKPFDSKRDINRWMAGLPRPLPYGAHTALRQLTSGLVRPHHHWLHMLDSNLDQQSCAGILEDILTRLQLPSDL